MQGRDEKSRAEIGAAQGVVASGHDLGSSFIYRRYRGGE